MNRTNTFYHWAASIALFFAISGNTFAQYTTNGSASSQPGDCWHLTEDQGGQAGSILAGPISLAQPFTLSGRYYFGNKDGNGADGIVFMFATTNTALGGTGGGLGYSSITPSFAWEVDTYQNGSDGDPASDHMAIMRNGSVNHNSADNLVGPINLPNVEDDEEHCFFISWSPSSNTFTASLDGNTIMYTGDIIGTIFGGNPSVYYGFSSGTGGLSNLHRVCFGPPVIDPMVDVTVCPSQSVQLQADPDGMTFTWAPHPTLTPLNVSNPTATPTQTTTYSVTIGFACGATAMDNVTVFVAQPPAAVASSNSPLCVGETLELMASGGLTYSWSGPQGFVSGQQFPTIPNVDLPNAGTYTVTVTDAAGCTGTASTQVVVFPNPIVAIIPVPFALCENGGDYQLSSIPATGGTWGGDVGPTGIVDPAALGPGNYTATYTFTNANGCTAMDDAPFEVVPMPLVQIIPSGPYCDTDPVQQLGSIPPGGLWQGAANSQGQVNPMALGVGTHLVTYTFVDGNGCMDTDSFNVVINQGTTVTINPAGPFCPTAPMQTLTASPMGGTWGGAANSNGQINPMALGPGNHLVTYSIPSGGGNCPGADSILVQIFTPPTANISGMGTVCQGSGQTVPLTITATGNGPFTVTYTINGTSPTSITVSAGTTTIPAGAPGTYELTVVTDANGCPGTVGGSAIVEVVTAPEVDNLHIDCDPTQTSFSVSFEVTGGDPSTYTVTSPTPGSFTTSPPYIFTSDFIPSGNPYSFTIDDVNGCDPVTVSGTFNCLCITESGTMNLTPLMPCADEAVLAFHNNNDTLDANDVLVFVLHSGNGNSLGTIFATDDQPSFDLVPPMLPGVTYYISAVAGDDDGTGNVDLNDPCLDVSFGTPVSWIPLPNGSISQSVSICQGESATIVFSLTGNAPFDVSYTAGTQNIDLNNIFNGHSITVTPAQTTTYTLEFIEDNSSPACYQQVSSSVTVTVSQHVTVPQSAQICEGESILLGGAMQTQPGTYADTLSTGSGCDSILVTTLTVNELDTLFLNDSSCDPNSVGIFTQTLTNANGCDSTVITTIFFSESDTTYASAPTCDPNAVGTFATTYTTPQGCDSTVLETFYLVPTDTVHLTDATCDPSGVGVFQENFTNQFGCDSVVLTTVTLLPSDTTELFDTSCDPASVGVFETLLTNQFGCDSTVVLTIEFSESDSVFLASQTCDPDLVGVFVENYVTPQGCDSTVTTTVALLPSDTVFLASQTCDPAQAGTFNDIFTNQFGCDSTVTETVTLLPSVTVFLASQTCDASQTGTFTDIFTNQFGCDSTVVTTITLLPPDECGVLIALSGDSIPCTATEGSLTIELLQGQSPFTYQWLGTGTPGSGNGTLSGNPAALGGLPGGAYSVTITSANGLTATAQAQIVQVTPPSLNVAVTSDFGGFALSCAGETDGSATATVMGDYPPYSLQWSNGSTGPSLANLPAGSYDVTVTGPYGCEAEASVDLAEPPPLSLVFSVTNLDCFGQNDGAITAEVTGGLEPYGYSLNGSVFQNSGTFPGLSDGTFALTVQDANGCETEESIFINAPVPVDVTLGDDLSIELGNDTLLHALVNIPPWQLANVTWSSLDTLECPTCLAQPVAPLITTTYSVFVESENGCTAEDAVTVFVDRRKSVYIPNAFSPNGDGINDEFYPFAKPNTVREVRSFLVFDRWGESVYEYFNFEPNRPTFGWNGHHKGEIMDPAVFTYFAEIDFLDGTVELFEGDVTLVR